MKIWYDEGRIEIDIILVWIYKNMSNFIEDFIDKVLKESNKTISLTDNWTLKSISSQKSRDKNSKSLYNEDNISKKIFADMENNLKNNNDSDNMNAIDKNTKIKIEKQSYKKTIFWIVFQFLLGVFLIAYSYSYLQTHEAQRKFFDSSIQYWKNLAVNLYAKLWWSFEDQVDQEYMDKRAQMVKTLSNLSIELNSCIAREKNSETLEQLKKTKNDIEELKRRLSNTDYLSLNEYIEKYQYYSLWVNSLKEWVENYCRK